MRKCENFSYYERGTLPHYAITLCVGQKLVELFPPFAKFGVDHGNNTISILRKCEMEWRDKFHFSHLCFGRISWAEHIVKSELWTVCNVNGDTSFLFFCHTENPFSIRLCTQILSTSSTISKKNSLALSVSSLSFCSSFAVSHSRIVLFFTEIIYRFPEHFPFPFFSLRSLLSGYLSTFLHGIRAMLC